MIQCDRCGVLACKLGTLDDAPDFCPTASDAETLLSSRGIYESDEAVRSMVLAAAEVEASGYMKQTRIEDTMMFAEKAGFNNLGIACCVGLRREGVLLASILRKRGFRVNFVFCKTGGIPKEDLGIPEEFRVNPDRFEASCNPVAQAMLLNEAETDLNIVVGLCVGHDAIFSRHSEAPVTTLIAKDRVLCHNPVGALYTSQSYYRKRLWEE